MFACITFVGRLAVLLALVLSVAPADATANVESRSKPDVKFDRYWQEAEEPEEPGSDLLFYQPLITGRCPSSCPQLSPAHHVGLQPR